MNTFYFTTGDNSASTVDVIQLYLSFVTPMNVPASDLQISRHKFTMFAGDSRNFTLKTLQNHSLLPPTIRISQHTQLYVHFYYRAQREKD